MGAKTHQIKMVFIRLAVEQYQIGTNMAVAVILPWSDQRMIVIAPGQDLVVRQSGHSVPEVGIQRLGEPAFFLAFVVSLESCGTPNRPHSDQPSGHRQLRR